MSEASKKKSGHTLISILCCIPFVALWYNIALMLSVARSEGVLSVFNYVYGNWIVYLGIVLAVFAFFSIIYLRFFIKKEWLVHLIAYLLTIGQIAAGIIALNSATREFEEFTTEKWTEFPAQRITMFADLKEKYDVKGYTTAEIEQLLGKPDTVSDDGTYIYSDMHNNAVYVEFKNEEVCDIYFIE